MAQRRVSHLSFNFDSLTDLVTNLAGALIMIVLLFFFLSSKNVKNAASAAAAGLPGRAGSPPNRASNVPALRFRTADLGPRLKQKQDELDKFKAQIAEIDRDAAKVQPREFADPNGTPGKPATVNFRPPMLSESDKGTGAFFVLMRGRVFFFKPAEYRKALKNFEEKWRAGIGEATRNGADLGAFELAEDASLPSGDYNIRFHANPSKVDKNGNRSASVTITPRLKGDARGEAGDEAKKPGSIYRALLDQLTPAEQSISYAVFPDSFALFLDLRQLILDRGFSYNWEPAQTGEELQLGTGGGVQ